MSTLFFEDYHQLLFPVAYKMLGDAADAEDIVQETMLKWLSVPRRKEIENPEGYLVRTLMNKCLNFIRDHRKKRSDVEIAPELLTDQLPGLIDKQPALALGMQAMLEKLTPMERAVFLLKEIFNYSHKEIAELLELSEEYCRQLLSRARRHLRNDRQRFEAKPEQHLQLYQTFVEVCKGADLGKLLKILREDIRIDISRPAASFQGALAVGEMLMRLPHNQIRYEWMWLKDLPVLVAYLYQQPAWIVRLEGHEQSISSIQIEVLGDHPLSPLDFLHATRRSTTLL
ncbi:MAG: sigma-70 family RNA polymerase sigma factor [Bacteroidota bacterium]